MTTGWTTDHGRTTAANAHLALKVDQQYINKMHILISGQRKLLTLKYSDPHSVISSSDLGLFLL